jgi:thiol-disulfide isomerase/thioredoxin
MKKVIKVSASYCAPCKVLEPIFNKIADELKSDKVSFKSVSDDHDYNEFEAISKKFGVRGVPTTLILDENDNVIDRVLGNLPEQMYRNFITKNLEK